ncbi:HU family DNA-binding protein [Candidatus Phytoplasma phoenicium]|uniref:Bacterial nucleoid DNA-binding protein n=1 Tax=Candidatus Phytoplasma phoenicium TaxID=198422 RepID=A0A0L0ML51_9MOLU|nr:HU family DNA-binding protein [Candidatus Phytoplasma phoenicium]KND62729.1 bacterial nucleoid DNA-binding protein [Candidatus Phytoplasma phoenicium]
MTKKELITHIAQQGQISITQTKAFYEIFEEVLYQGLSQEGEVVLSPEIGKLILSTQAARIYPEMKRVFYPKKKKYRFQPTGRKLEYPAVTVVRFRPATSLKQAVKPIILKKKS